MRKIIVSINLVLLLLADSYTEDTIFINVIDGSIPDDITIEGGWNSDFTG